jgi:branched-chain amino acid transport system substrate-binding protein
MGKRIAASIILVLTSMALVACGVFGGSGGGSGSEINIGYTGPLSGGAAFYGKDVLNGITMAVNQINSSGGITVNGKNVTLKVVPLDDKYLPNEAATNAKRLVGQYQTPIVFCPHSGGVLAIQGFNAKQQPNFILAAYSSEPLILQQNNPLTAMIPPRYDAYFKPFAQIEMQKFGKKLGLIATTTAYGNKWKKGFAKVWKELGGQVLSDNSVNYNSTTDFSNVVSKALSEHPDVLFVGGPSQPTALVIKAARDQGFKGGFVVMDQAKFENMAGIVPQSMLNGAVGVMPLIKYPGPGTTQFVDAFKKEFGQDKVPNSEIAQNYQAMWVFAEAMKLAGTTTDVKAIMAKMPEAIKALPAQYKPYGVTDISSTGHLKGPVIAAFVKDGKYTSLDIPSLDR